MNNPNSYGIYFKLLALFQAWDSNREQASPKLRLASGWTYLPVGQGYPFPNGLVFLILTNIFNSSWNKSLAKKWTSEGFSTEMILMLGYEQPKLVLGQRVLDMEGQKEQASLPRDLCANSLFVKLKPAQYLNRITIPHFGGALTLTNFNALPTWVPQRVAKKMLHVGRLSNAVPVPSNQPFPSSCIVSLIQILISGK